VDPDPGGQKTRGPGFGSGSGTLVVDPRHFDADPDSTYHPDADPDFDFYSMRIRPITPVRIRIRILAKKAQKTLEKVLK
jgi:hypothetical protein